MVFTLITECTIENVLHISIAQYFGTVSSGADKLATLDRRRTSDNRM